MYIFISNAYVITNTFHTRCTDQILKDVKRILERYVFDDNTQFNAWMRRDIGLEN